MIETIPIFLVGYAAGELGEAMADRLSDRPTREITTRASGPVRTLDPTPVIPPSINTGTPPRTVSSRAPITDRFGGNGRGAVPVSTSNPSTGSSGEAGAGSGSKYFYDVNDRGGLLADLFLRAFGADDPLQGQTQYSVVPQQVGGSSSSGNMGLMLLVIAGAGVAIWYFYFR